MFAMFKILYLVITFIFEKFSVMYINMTSQSLLNQPGFFCLYKIMKRMLDNRNTYISSSLSLVDYIADKLPLESEIIGKLVSFPFK